MEITSAIYRTILSGPAQVTFARVVGKTKTPPVYTRMIACSSTVVFTVTGETLTTFTAERTVCVCADRLAMTVVQAETTLVNIWTMGVRPSGCCHVQYMSA